MDERTLDAERAVVSAILAAPERLRDVSDTLTADDFSDALYGLVYGSLVELEKNGSPADIVLLRDKMKRDGTIDRIGGDKGLATLTDYYVSPVNLEHYADIVVKQAMRRRLSASVTQAFYGLTDQKADVAEIIAEVERALCEASSRTAKREPVSVRDLLQGHLNDIVERFHSGQKGITGITCGFTGLDQKLSGLHRQELIILAGRPSMGKSTFMLNMARKMALTGLPILIFSLEMSASNLMGNLLSAESGVNGQAVRVMSLNQGQLDNIVSGASRINDLPIYIDDTGGLDLNLLKATARRMKRRYGIEAIFIDYLQLVTVSYKQGRSREQEVAQVSGGLKALAKELEIPVVALSQLSRQNTQRGDPRPMLSDLRESGAIEQDADVVMFVHRPEYYKSDDHPGEAEIIISKQRNGPTGKENLAFIGNQLRFENLAQRDEGERF